MRFLRDHNPDLSGSLIVAMGTLFGAWALRADKFCGSLKPEKKADLAVVALPDQEAVPTDPYSLILNSNLPMVATWLEGELVFSMS